MKLNSLYDEIDEFAKNTPHKVAIEHGCSNITYEELYKQSNTIASKLIKDISCNKNFALIIDRSIELITSLIGVMKIGGVFVPIDPNYPINRIEYMMDNSKCDKVITTKYYLHKFFYIFNKIKLNYKIIVVDEDDENIDDKRFLNYNYNEESYIFFSSGSTGNPKGILGKQSSLRHFIQWEINEFKIDSSFRISQIISPSFDACLRDIFVPLVSGATLCIPENNDIILNPLKLAEWIDKENITLTHMVKTLFTSMINEVNEDSIFLSLKYVLLSGEALHGSDIKKFYEIFNERIEIINLYGATETTLVKTFYRIKSNDVNKSNICIGKPIDGTKIRILNDNFEECNENECGEIYIESDYITFGYYKDDVKTKEKFLKSKYSENGTTLMYRTGDIGRLLKDGNYECLGRIDRQIKINGARIEPGEIENVFKNYFDVNEVIATSISINGKEKLYLYYSGSEQLCNDEIKERLMKYLPSYMMPSKFVYIKKMPILPNGKININELPIVEHSYNLTKDNYFFDDYEKKVANVICEVMGLDAIGIDDDFLSLGGNSIDAAQVALRLYKKYDFHILVLDILKIKTVRNIAEYIRDKKDTKYIPILSNEALCEYPLTPSQRSLFLLSKIHNVGISYNLHELIEINGKINVEDINLAYKKLIKEEEILRSCIKMIDGEIVQIINSDITASIEVIDYSNMYKDRNIKTKDIKGILKNLIKEFDIEKAPLIRMYLIKITEEKHFLLIDMHHIIADGSSQELIKYKLSQFINNKPVEKLRVKYKDYSLWINNRLKSDKILKLKNYWMRLYENDIPVLELPTDFNRPPIKSFNGDSIIKFIDSNLSKKIRKFSAKESKTLYSFMLTVFIVLLNKYTSQEDIVVGTVVAGRNHPELDKIIGMFVNTIPVRIQTNNCKNFMELLNEISRTLLFSMENQEYPFEKIIEDLKINPKLSRSQLFDVMFIMKNMNSFNLEIDGTSTRSIIIEEERAKFDITLTVSDEGEDIMLSFEYSTDLYKKSTIERMIKHYEFLLNECMEKCYSNIDEINMMLVDEKEFINEHLNNYASNDFKVEETFIDLFINQVNKNPNKIAITFKDVKITYKELDIASDYLAGLLYNKALEDDAIIAIVMKRTPLILISIIAILKMGYAYLPIDTDYPPDRIKYMIKDSNCRLILSDSKNANSFYVDIDIINLDFWELLKKHKIEKLLINKSKMNKVAYLIYTSGSTGKPKGVMITNKNLSSFIFAINNEIKIYMYEKILALTTISFDIFVMESILPLSQGLEVILCDELDQQNPNNIKNILQKNKIDILQVTPSRLSLMIEALGSIEFLNKIKLLIIGGEQFHSSLLNILKPLNDIRVFNVYGPTEATVWCSIKELTNEDSVTIGRPLCNADMYILNKKNYMQPIGVYGELCISGECLSKGYINKEDITREKFISHPFKIGHTMYKTGDIVRLLENGYIEFIGRQDFQVKLRGYRIELNEIQKCIEEFGQFTNCVCDVKYDSIRGKFLVAYYESKNDANISDVRELLSKKLPDYMIPSVFMRLDKMPITKNGKIDRAKLPFPQIGRPTLSRQYKKVSTEIEKEILSIWNSILGIDNIGVNDNFFELGGNSILLVRMHSRLEEKYKRQINIADLFSHPTIFLLSKYITGVEKNNNCISTLILPEEYFNVENNVYSDGEYEYNFSEDIRQKINYICTMGYNLESFMFTFYIYIFYKITKTEDLYFYKIIDSNKGMFSKININLEKYSTFIDVIESLSKELELNETFFINDIDNIRNRKNEMAIVFSIDKSLPAKAIEYFDLITIVENKNQLKAKYYFNSFKINSSKIEELMTIYINLIETVARDYKYIRRSLRWKK